VDDLKISHSDPAIVTDVIKMFQSEFGKEAPLTMMHGKVHEYLGMKKILVLPVRYNSPWKSILRGSLMNPQMI